MRALTDRHCMLIFKGSLAGKQGPYENFYWPKRASTIAGSTGLAIKKIPIVHQRFVCVENNNTILTKPVFKGILYFEPSIVKRTLTGPQGPHEFFCWPKTTSTPSDPIRSAKILMWDPMCQLKIF